MPSLDGVGVLNTSGVAVLVSRGSVGVTKGSVGVLFACGSQPTSNRMIKTAIHTTFFMVGSPNKVI